MGWEGFLPERGSAESTLPDPRNLPAQDFPLLLTIRRRGHKRSHCVVPGSPHRYRGDCSVQLALSLVAVGWYPAHFTWSTVK